MKRKALTIIIFLFSSGLFAQGVINNGGKIVIGPGVYFNINGTGGNYTNRSNITDGSMDLSGTLQIAGNYTNNVVASDILSSNATGSEVVFNGTSDQSIGGTTTALFTFPKLTINNLNSNLAVLKDIQVDDSMKFINGLVDIGNNNLTFGPNSVVTGSPSAISMIVATGAGQVKKIWTTIGTFTFPVGDNNITAKYSPVTLNFTSGTFSLGALVGLNLVDSKYNDPAITGSYLNRYWNISQSGISGFISNAVFQYLTSDVIGNESNIACYRVFPTPTTIFSPANTGLHQLYAFGLISFGTITGGLGVPTPTTYTVTGSGSYCQGETGIPVALSNSDTGVIYTLYKDGIAQMPTISGTGSAISFGNQLMGVYTVSGYDGFYPTPMTGNAVINENPIITPIFNQFGPYCEGTTADILPTISINGISGSWNASINTVFPATSSYTFTPNIGSCAIVAFLDITVNPVFAFTESHTICAGQTYNWQGTDYTAEGTYYANYLSTSGCDSIYTLNLGVNPVYAFVENHSICIGQTYNWHGVDYTTAGTYTDNHLSIFGCDSSYTLNLTVNPVYAFTEFHTICNGQTYNWHGIDYTNEGTYYANYLSTSGCDSTYTLNLNVNPVYAFTENHTICSGQTYNWHGVDYTTAGTYTDNHLSINGCDSSYTLNLTVNPFYAFTENHSICDGQTYNWHGVDYTTAGTYTDNHLSIFGCDSSYTLNLTVNPVYAFTENHSICDGQTYNWHGVDYTTEGAYSANYLTTSGCDSIYTLYLGVNPSYAFTENHSICDGQTYNWHGVDYTTAGTYTDNHLSIFGCDSSYTLNLTVNPVYAFTEYHTVCNGQTYNWHGVDYTTEGVYSANYLTTSGCDSIYTLYLGVNPLYAFTENHSICDGQTYNWHGVDYTTEGAYSANYLTTSGCDSIYTLYLGVNPLYAFTENHSICDGQTYNWHGVDYTTAGTYTDNHLSIFGCDSSYTLNLTVNPVYAFTEYHTVCNGQTYNWHGVDYTTEGVYSANYLTTSGCDSIYTLYLGVNPSYAFTENHSICDGQTYNWHGVDYTTAGTYTDNHLSIFGCDSSYTLNLTVNPVYAFTEFHTICNGQTYNWHGVDYTTEGAYSANYLTTSGCDSIYTLYLGVNPLYAFTENHSICDGQTYNWHGVDYTTAGIYTDNHLSIFGCDSSYTLNLTVNPVYAFTEFHTICNGQTYNWHGVDYTTEGAYSANYLTTSGCDSIYTLYLGVNPVYAFAENHSICDGQTYNWHGVDYTTAGTYTDNHLSINGCDSSYTLNLTVNPVYAFTENHSICNGQTYNWHGVDYTNEGTYYANYLSTSGCDSIYTLNLGVNPVYAFVENHSIFNGQTYNWHGVDYTTAGTYTDNHLSINGCDSSYTLNLIVNPLTKTLQIKVFIEGLYIGGGMMHEAFDYVNNSLVEKWGAGIADTIFIELYDDSYGSIVARYPGVYLNTSGILTIPTVNASLGNSYYITIFHRNSMPVTSALPVSFAGTTINYDFTTPADQAYGVGSQKALGGGFYGLYTGELDHDAYYFIDGDDNTIMEPAVIASTLGCLLEDLDGSGYVDGDDNVIMEPNVIISPYFQNPLTAKKKLMINQSK